MIQQFNSYVQEKGRLEYRCRGCNNNLTSNDPASQYQRQKLIQNTVRVKSSLFTMNLAALTTYQTPNSTYKLVDVSGNSYIVSPGVNWNQMSDRREPHIQVVKTGAGSGYHSSSTKHTITANRPGAMSPGGAGVDIKHNSYDRYLNRLKGKAPVRRGVIPPTFGLPYIPFNRADPIYGGKIMKTSIVNGCNCPIGVDNGSILYKNSSLQDQILAVKYKFNVGDTVWAKKVGDLSGELYKATITAITNDLYTIRFADGTIDTVDGGYISIYYDCNGCISTNSSTESTLFTLQSDTGNVICDVLSTLSEGALI